jgi:predicted esterase
VDILRAVNDISHRLQKAFLSGFSQGAALSIYSVLKRLISCSGFVAVAPSDWVRPEEKPATERNELSRPFASFVRASDCRGLRGVVIVGDKDPFFHKIERLYTLMVERGLDGKLQVEKGIGHEYPQGFDNKLRAAVEFVSGSNT